MIRPHGPPLFALSLALALSAPADEPARAPIWQVSDADSTVYLAGSIHLLREKDLPLPAAFDRVYAAADELVFEIDMATLTDPGTALEMRRLGSLPAGETLADRFSPETMERLRDYLRRQGRAAGFFDRSTPGMVYLMLASFEAARQGADAALGLETTYYAKSLADGKPSRGLETIAYQLSRLDAFEPEQMEALVNAALDEAGGGAATLDAIVAEWRQGDAAGLAAVLADDETFPAGLRERLLTERNRNWIPEIERALATDRDVMFLVGAAHLVGDDSVVAMLREKGHPVAQVAGGE